MTLRLKLIISLFILLSGSCKNAVDGNDSASNKDNVVVANEFIDAFYSFDKDRLKSMLSSAEGSQPNILYYQKWAECGNYKVIKRSDCIVRSDSVIICPVTVKDDLMAGLNIDFNVTDSFHITIVKRKIRAVETSSNDPDAYYDAKEWVKQNRPSFIEKPCEGIWEGGPTPCECIKGMIKGFAEFTAIKGDLRN